MGGVGDSRCILVKKRRADGKIGFKQMSVDHKPDKEEEMQRIIKSKGAINPIYLKQKQEYVGVQRVWVKGHDFPGLAMSRSLGDKLAHTVGVISTPDIFECILKPDKHQYWLVMGSDGLWD